MTAMKVKAAVPVKGAATKASNNAKATVPVKGAAIRESSAKAKAAVPVKRAAVKTSVVNAVVTKTGTKKNPKDVSAKGAATARKAEEDEEAKVPPFLRSLCPRVFRSTRLGRQLANVKEGAAMRTVKNVKVKSSTKTKKAVPVKGAAKAAEPAEMEAEAVEPVSGAAMTEWDANAAMAHFLSLPRLHRRLRR